MALATFKDLCIDSSPDEALGRFWAAATGLTFEPDEDAGALVGSLVDSTPQQRIWMNVVPEPKTVKQRVHLDVHAASVEGLVALGAEVLEPAADFDRGWTVMTDPEGGEFCAFVRPPEQLPSYRLYELVVDAEHPRTITTWWADVLGADLGGEDDETGWWLSNVPGMPFEAWVFDHVTEPKTVRNRIHWDVTVRSLDLLVGAGATVLRPRDDEIGWTVMTDPEGNEFCAFSETSTETARAPL
ncbi:MAG: VOC family protein [Nocardioidaceae bacterium]